jgi:hypothetical protein
MILPTKHLAPDRTLLAIGAELLGLLDEPKTVSRLWNDLGKFRSRGAVQNPLTFDWFVLALDMLFALKAITPERGRIQKALT